MAIRRALARAVKPAAPAAGQDRELRPRPCSCSSPEEVHEVVNGLTGGSGADVTQATAR